MDYPGIWKGHSEEMNGDTGPGGLSAVDAELNVEGILAAAMSINDQKKVTLEGSSQWWDPSQPGFQGSTSGWSSHHSFQNSAGNFNKNSNPILQPDDIVPMRWASTTA